MPRLTFGRAWPWTRALLAVNVVVHLLDILLDRGRPLLRAGVKYGPLIWRGEYHRLFTASFLHADLAHLAMNGLGIHLLGSLLEPALGGFRFLFLYLLGGLAGTAASLAFQPFALSVGASGALFGLVGYLLLVRWRQPLAVSPTLRSWLTAVLVINALFALFPGSRIDRWGHLGGLAGGFLGGIVVGLPGGRDALLAAPASRAAAAIVLAWFFWWSLQPPV